MVDEITPEQRDQLSAVGAASGLGCAIVVTMIVLIGGGVALDQAIGTSPLFTLAGVVLGLVAAGYQLWELAQVGRSDRPPPPLTRGLSKLPLPKRTGHGPG
ncbi:MAG: AtpZ/AtpI family protein [Chloroflexia bacterium]|nr:AtpZ/AtpI family protein [Chloroflexia bacterium]MDQ3514600.1 AtpZ/AtpI family protein [Chloroflexota bacterium]